MFSNLSRKKIISLTTFDLSSANAFNLDDFNHFVRQPLNNEEEKTDLHVGHGDNLPVRSFNPGQPVLTMQWVNMLCIYAINLPFTESIVKLHHCFLKRTCSLTLYQMTKFWI